ncbi:hypothetical protein D3C72_1263340 [compost metagenome]
MRSLSLLWVISLQRGLVHRNIHKRPEAVPVRVSLNEDEGGGRRISRFDAWKAALKPLQSGSSTSLQGDLAWFGRMWHVHHTRRCGGLSCAPGSMPWERWSGFRRSHRLSAARTCYPVIAGICMGYETGPGHKEPRSQVGQSRYYLSSAHRLRNFASWVGGPFRSEMLHKPGPSVLAGYAGMCACAPSHHRFFPNSAVQTWAWKGIFWKIEFKKIESIRRSRAISNKWIRTMNS